ncbi:hypothetical protein QCA50_003723 [Cerrena zonata]|uniref:2OGFeDO JBP1/TET oxygenase domain-containing protein n=1 Tax=Cerrena zonata TaxID=2478898 RepID=A0AAW0FLC0_9APHY
MSTYIPDINGDQHSSDVAAFMQKLFKYQLAVSTLHPSPPQAPDCPSGWSRELLDVCTNAVRMLIIAFTNIKYISWDFAEYCRDCKRSSLGCGGNIQREEEILRRWPPQYSPTAHVDEPRVFADPSGRIITWILPSIIPPHYQDKLYQAVCILEPSFTKKFHGNGERGSWRTDSAYFDPDNDYISTGLANLSAAWYMAGHKSPPYTTPFLQRSEGHKFVSVARDPFAVVSGILAITHPQQYEMAKEMKDSMITSGNCAEALGRWPTVFTAISVITNRESPFHRDLHESWKWFDFLLSFGPYKHAPLYLANLGIRVNNPPGTICIFGGRALWHGVRRVSPRVTLALYMRKNIQKELGIQSASWMTQQEYSNYIGPQRHNLRRHMPTNMNFVV